MGGLDSGGIRQDGSEITENSWLMGRLGRGGALRAGWGEGGGKSAGRMIQWAADLG